MKRFAIVVLLGLVSPAIFAHTGFSTDGFTSGIVHPLLGLDHILAMLSVGLWAAFMSRELRQCWRLPTAFMVFMLIGALLGASGFPLAAAESGIALSVLLLGAVVCAMTRVSMSLALTLVAVFAVFHGYAHGAEMQNGAVFTGYAAGFMLATGLLHLAGVLLGRCLLGMPALYRATGMVVSAAGLVLLSQSV